MAEEDAKKSSGSKQVKEQAAFRANYFPLGYKEAASQWWASISPAAAEHKVLSYIPFLQSPPTQLQSSSLPNSAPGTPPASASLPVSKNASTTSVDGLERVTTNKTNDPYGPRRWNSHLVQLSGKDRALNEFSVERVGEEVEENLVLLHGYGAGLGFYYKNFEGLSQTPGWKIWALDLLGMGRSSRPPFRIHAKDQQGKIKEAEDWFIDALEEWRIKRGINRFTLLGHSLGGYLATAYALKYPGRLKKLILASPVGIPEDPFAVNAAMPEPGDSTLQNEFTQNQEDVVSESNSKTVEGGKADNNNFLNARAKAEQDIAKGKNVKPTDPNAAPRRPVPKWLSYLWDANVSPFGLVRWAGPLGPRLVSGWTSRRFSHLPPEESQALHDYSYSLFRQRGSGEYVLAYVLAPGAFARSPLINRIAGVGRQPLPTTGAPTVATPTVKKETGIPVVMMYGEHDWMDIKGGHAAEKKLEAAKREALKTATKEEKQKEDGSAKVLIIKKAGHHVYLDGYDEFNEIMRREMKETLDKGKREKEQAKI